MKTKESKIKQIRRHRGISQSDMAKRLHMSQSGYSKIEKGSTKLDVQRLIEIAEILDIDFNELISSSENVSISHNKISGSNVGYNEINYSDMKENYEARIVHLEQEIKFLRSQLSK